MKFTGWIKGSVNIPFLLPLENVYPDHVFIWCARANNNGNPLLFPVSWPSALYDVINIQAFWMASLSAGYSRPRCNT
jgi:hypothetical protein